MNQWRMSVIISELLKREQELCCGIATNNIQAHCLDIETKYQQAPALEGSHVASCCLMAPHLPNYKGAYEV